MFLFCYYPSITHGPKSWNTFKVSIEGRMHSWFSGRFPRAHLTELLLELHGYRLGEITAPEILILHELQDLLLQAIEALVLVRPGQHDDLLDLAPGAGSSSVMQAVLPAVPSLGGSDPGHDRLWHGSRASG